MARATPWARLRRRVDAYEKKTAERPEEYGRRACADLEQLVQLRAAIESEIDDAIIRAREAGASWTFIPYGGSKQAAQQRHAAAVRRRQR